MKNHTTQLHQLLIAETRKRLLEEGLPRIKKCLSKLSEQEIWYKPNDNSNSVGNLVLHLCGNVQQWILTGLGKQKDIRERDAEFEEKGPILATILTQNLDKLMQNVDTVLTNLTPDDLVKTHDVQIYKQTGVSILVHVAEHFSYHVGQITYFTKWKKDVDVDYYPEDLI